MFLSGMFPLFQEMEIKSKKKNDLNFFLDVLLFRVALQALNCLLY